MRKLFSLIAAVLFAGSMMATEVIFTNADFAGQGTANTGSEVSATKGGVTFTYSKGYSADESLRCYAHGSLSITATATIEKINFTTTGGKNGGLDAEVTVNATSYSVDDLASQARFTEIKVTLSDGGVTPPVEPETIPTTAPAAPAQAEADVMGIYCNHYAVNNANFNLSGWPGAYQTLTLDGTTVGFMPDMTWECIIDPVNTDAAHNFSAYENIHIDMWAPQAAKIKFAAEAVAGGNYKDGHIVELAQGWNSFDFAIAEWPGNYDFANLKCFVFEQYQTPAGESFEHNPFAFANLYFWNAPVVVTPQYEVAEAIAAGLADDDVIEVRGVITKMEFKGKNFAKYGSVNIYVKDATGAEGEFEFYNCYSLNADTFKTSTPAYDAESTAWAEFTEVADANGNAIHVGDTVIAHGKYKLYNTTYELNTGCYLIDVKHASGVTPGETIDVNMSGLYYSDYVAAAGWWQIYGGNEQFIVSISNVSTTEAAGVYTIADLDADYTYLEVIADGDTIEVAFVDGSVTLTVADNGDVTVAGALTGDDGNIYNLNLVFNKPVATTTKNVQIAEWELDDAYLAYGLFSVAGEAADGTFVQFGLWMGDDQETIAGDYTEADTDSRYLGTGIIDGGVQPVFYTAAIHIELAEEAVVVTADVLCYGNVLYKITTLVESIDNVDAAVKAIKSIVNGQVVIEKAGKTFNMNGAVVR